MSRTYAPLTHVYLVSSPLFWPSREFLIEVHKTTRAG